MDTDKQAPEATAPRLLSLEDILNAPDINTKVIPMPEWGGSVEITGLTMEQVETVRKTATVMKPRPGGAAIEDIDKDTFAYALLAASAVNPKLTIEQARSLRVKAAVPMDRLFKEVLAICGLNKEAVRDSEKSPVA